MPWQVYFVLCRRYLPEQAQLQAAAVAVPRPCAPDIGPPCSDAAAPRVSLRASGRLQLCAAAWQCALVNRPEGATACKLPNAFLITQLRTNAAQGDGAGQPADRHASAAAATAEVFAATSNMPGTTGQPHAGAEEVESIDDIGELEEYLQVRCCVAERMLMPASVCCCCFCTCHF